VFYGWRKKLRIITIPHDELVSTYMDKPSQNEEASESEGKNSN
jgi:hypothetical protein